MDIRKNDGKSTRRTKSFKEVKDDFLEILGGFKQQKLSSNLHDTNGRPIIQVVAPSKMAPSSNDRNSEKEIECCRKEIDRALNFFLKVVEARKIEMVHHSATVVLETVLAFHALAIKIGNNDHSTVTAELSAGVFQCVALLIKWSDAILIHGEEAFNQKDIKEAVAALVEAIQNFRVFIVDKLRSQGPVIDTQSTTSQKFDRGSLPDFPLTSEEKMEASEPGKEIQRRNHSFSTDSILSVVRSEEKPPPKPPMYKRDSAPPLPPKRRKPFDSYGSSLASQQGLVSTDLRRSVSPTSLRNSRGSSSPLDSGSSLSIDSCLNPSLDSSMSNRSDDLDLCRIKLERSNRLEDSSARTFHRRIGSDGYEAIFNDRTLRNIRQSGAIFTPEERREFMDIENGLAAERAETESGIFTSLPCEISCGVKSSKYESQRSYSTITRVTGFCVSESTISEESFRLAKNQQIGQEEMSSLLKLQAEAVAFNQMTSAFEKVELEPNRPPLPAKLRLKRGSVYDNVSCSLFNASHFPDIPNTVCVQNNIGEPIVRNQVDFRLDLKPPPLPPKKKAIDCYMNVMPGDYSISSNAEFVRHSVYNLCKQSAKTRLYSQRSVATFSSALLSSDIGTFTSDYLERLSRDYLTEEGLVNLTPPALPPKKRLSCPPPGSNISVEEKTDELKENTPLPVSDKVEFEVPSNVPIIVNTEDKNSEEHEGVTAEEYIPIDEIDVTKSLIFDRHDDDTPELRGGPVDALIVYAASTTKNGFLYQEAFLTTYRTFCAPEDLITKLIYRYNRFIHKIDQRQKAARSAFSLLVRVIDDLAIIDLNVGVLKILTEFVQELISSGCLIHAKALRTKLLEKYVQKQRVLNDHFVYPAMSLKGMSLNLLEFKAEAMAEQMTLIDAAYFNRLELAEVLLWAKEQNEEKSPNLTKFTEHFNKVSYWARSQILEREDAKEREKYVMRFLKIMKHLRKLNNFNSYLALLSALDSAPIRRLEWQKRITDGLDEFCALIDSSCSFRTYRQALAESGEPCIPYIGLILQDLTFINLGNQDFLEEGVVNFGKRWLQFHILENMKRFKKCNYPLKRDEKIMLFLNEFNNYLSEDAMWSISESIKPRGGIQTLKKY
ncbi:rap guanine nucleotide exchange factor 1-like isoform X1 [Artemia franciscana]|uniref:CRK SH3-binding GNRP n=1 Tax=Artemia franciscana TaxID=6661 RepID=A0AA88HDJ2_ARTSF|nr:hypothetical protein QYM36_018127 [Artemia franciscana]